MRWLLALLFVVAGQVETTPVTLSWNIDPSHDGNVTWQVEIDGSAQTVACGNVQVFPTDRRCTFTSPRGTHTYRLRGTAARTEGIFIGEWSQPVSANVDRPGPFTLRAHFEQKQKPPAPVDMGSYSFDGSNDVIQYAESAALDALELSEYLILMWTRPGAGGHANGRLIQRGENNSTDTEALHMNIGNAADGSRNDNFSGRQLQATSVNRIVSGAVVPAGSWYQVGYQYRQGTLGRLFLNGASTTLAVSQAGSGAVVTNGTLPVSIGDSGTTPTRPYLGHIAYIGIWNISTLSDADVDSLVSAFYNGGTGNPNVPRQDVLVEFLRLNTDGAVDGDKDVLVSPSTNTASFDGAQSPPVEFTYEYIKPVANGTVNVGATSGGQIDITKPAGIQNGDFMFLVISGNNSGATLPNLIDENTGKEWTILDDRSEASVMRTWVLGRIANNEPATWNFALDLDTVGFVAVLAAYRGVHATTWEDVESAYDFNIDPSNVSDCPSLTPLAAGAMSICVGLIDNVASTLSSGPAGYTERVRQDTGRDAVIFDREITTPAATGAKQINWSTSDDTQGFHFILRPAGVAGGPSAALTGTALDGITEADVVAGGKTIIITLTGDEFIP